MIYMQIIIEVLEVFSQELASKNTAIFKEYAQLVSHEDLEVWRIEAREKFTYNYLFHSALYKITTEALSYLFVDELNNENVSQIFSTSIWVSQLMFYLTLLSILCMTLVYIKDRIIGLFSRVMPCGALGHVGHRYSGFTDNITITKIGERSHRNYPKLCYICF